MLRSVPEGPRSFVGAPKVRIVDIETSWEGPLLRPLVDFLYNINEFPMPTPLSQLLSIVEFGTIDTPCEGSPEVNPEPIFVLSLLPVLGA